MKRTGGSWSLKERGKFFCPVDWTRPAVKHYVESSVGRRDILMAVTTAPNPGEPEFGTFAKRHNLLLDSGVFALATATARENGLSFDEALQLHPSAIKGYDKNMAKYRAILDRLKDDLWGYVEVDYGGKEMKKAVRAELEEDGYAPIPVFHAGHDGWDYFRELDEQYDRICLGSLAQGSNAQRLEWLVRLAKERRHCKWVHALGVTPFGLWISCPTESCDSTAYKNGHIYGGPTQGLAQWRKVMADTLHYRTENDKPALMVCGWEEGNSWSEQIHHKMLTEPNPQTKT